MAEVISIEDIKKQYIKQLEIPGFDIDETITIEVKKPQIMRMASEGKIPNALMGVARKMVEGVDEPGDADLKDMAQVMELYCRACMVSPTFNEMKDIITDEQMLTIFTWAMGGVESLIPFRTDTEDGSSNNDV